MKIAHIITRMNLGGAEENTLLTCQGLAARGHEVTLITGLSNGPEGNLLEHSDLTGIRVIEVPRLIREISPLQDARAYAAIAEICRRGGFDVVHTHASKAGIIGRYAGWNARVPFVAHTIHGLPFHAFQSRLKNRLFKAAERRAAARCHRIYAVAQSMVEQSVSAGIAPREKFQVVYSGMNLAGYMNARRDPALRESLGIPADALVVGTAARIFPQKGYEDFIQVMPELARAVPALRFLIVGDGDMRPAFEEQLRHLGIRDRVIFTGMVPPDRVRQFIPQMDVLVHLSFHEGLPRTVVQALAARVPVVAYPVDGTPEVVDDGINGYLPELRNCSQVTRRVLELLEDGERRRAFGEAGREKVRARFDTTAMVDALEQDYLIHLEKNHALY